VSFKYLPSILFASLFILTLAGCGSASTETDQVKTKPMPAVVETLNSKSNQEVQRDLKLAQYLKESDDLMKSKAETKELSTVFAEIGADDTLGNQVAKAHNDIVQKAFALLSGDSKTLISETKTEAAASDSIKAEDAYLIKITP
jgi:hypothetical protein